MQIIMPQSNNKINTKNRFKVSFVLIIILILSGIIYFIADLSASYISSGILGTENNNSIVFSNKQTVYYLVINDFEKSEEALILANNIKNLGAAGYVKRLDKYCVIAHTYIDKNSAENVLKKMKETYSNAYIYTCEINQKSYSAKSYTEQQEQILNKAVESFFDNYNILYNISTKYDKGEINMAAAQNEIKAQSMKFENIISEFSASFNETDLTLLTLKNRLTESDKKIDDLVAVNQTELHFTSSLKYTCCALLEFRNSL